MLDDAFNDLQLYPKQRILLIFKVLTFFSYFWKFNENRNNETNTKDTKDALYLLCFSVIQLFTFERDYRKDGFFVLKLVQEFA
jgi:hypothetical protein